MFLSVYSAVIGSRLAIEQMLFVAPRKVRYWQTNPRARQWHSNEQNINNLQSIVKG